MDRNQFPQNLEAERAAIGGVIAEGTLADCINSKLDPNDFYDSRHKDIVQAIKDNIEQGTVVDLVTVAEALRIAGNLEKVGGASYLANLPTTHTAETFLIEPVRLIKEAAQRRQMIAHAEEIKRQAQEGKVPSQVIAAQAQDTFLNMDDQGQDEEFEELGSASRKAFKKAEDREAAKGAMSGLDTGLTDLNRLTGGLQPADLIAVGGRTSHGKTVLAMNLAERVAALGRRILYFSTEMEPYRLAERLICSWSGISSSDWRFAGASKSFDEGQWDRITQAVGHCHDLPILISKRWGQRIDLIRSAARKVARREPVDLIVVDYLQQVKPAKSARSREQEVAAVSWNLKEMARELQVPVIAVSQLNRETDRRSKGNGVTRPRNSDLRESGAIEQDADMIILIHHPTAEPGQAPPSGRAELILSKNRNGPPGVIPVRWDGERYRFQNLCCGDLK